MGKSRGKDDGEHLNSTIERSRYTIWRDIQTHSQNRTNINSRAAAAAAEGLCCGITAAPFTLATTIY